MLGLDTKSLIIGMILGAFIVPKILAMTSYSK